MSETSAVGSLRIDGLVGKPQTISWQDLADFPATERIADISQLGAKRRGEAVRLSALLELVAVSSDATYIGLHATRDDFHASVPLASVRDRALVVYALDGQPLTPSAGGPFRFFIPDHQACHTHEIDECANVKFVDWIELTHERGHDNRPQDDASHDALHQK